MDLELEPLFEHELSESLVGWMFHCPHCCPDSTSITAASKAWVQVEAREHVARKHPERVR